jgi:hypothetical protein
MQNNTVKNFLAIYDFRGPDEFIPNAFNYYYSYELFKNSGNVNDNVIQHFFKNYTQVSVYNAFLNLDKKLFEKETIFNYLNKKNKYRNYKMFYLIEPFGSFNQFLGNQFNGFSETTFVDFISNYSKNEIINNDDFYLLINYSTEGVVPADSLVKLYKILEEHKIPEHKVILLTASVDINEIHQKIRKHNPKKIKTKYWNWSLRLKSKELLNIFREENYKFWDNIEQINSIVKESDIDKTKIRKYKFINFNRRLRPHRLILLSLFGDDFIKNNLVSFDMKLFDREIDNDFFSYHLKSENLQKQSKEGFNTLFELKSKTIDYDDIESVWGFNFENKNVYLDSYIHILSETNFYENGLYLSEKTWKPIGHLQPFIMINRPGAIKELNNLGFKTFHPFIDETYDSIIDDRERLEFIYNEIIRLNSISIEEIHEWYNSIFEILIYNRNLLFEYAENCEDSEINFLKSLIKIEDEETNNLDN